MIYYDKFFKKLNIELIEITEATEYKNSSGDEIANANFLRRHRTCTVEASAYAHWTDFLISTITKHLRPLNRVIRVCFAQIIAE